MRSVLAACVLALVALTALPASAQDAVAAHAVLESASPAQGSEVDSAPAAVSLTFGEAVTVDRASLRVLTPSGARADNGDVVHPNGAASQVSVGLQQDLPRGSYTVVWRVISADSHPVSGTYSFGLGVPAGTAVSAGIRGSQTVGVLNGIARFVGYAGLVLAFGVAAFAGVVSRRVWALARVRRLFGIGAALLGVSGVALLLLAGPYDAGTGLGQLFAGSLLHATVDTRYGRLMIVRILVAALAAITAVFLVSADARPRRRVRVDVPTLAVVGVLTFALAEHSGTGTQAPLAAAMDSLHLLAVSAWVGGLVLIATTLLRQQAIPEIEEAGLWPRWSRLALGCVVVIIATGAYQSWRNVGTFPAFATTTYGRLLLVKIGLLVVLVGLGSYGRRWVRRRPTDRSPLSLRRSVGTEVVLSAGVIAVAAVLVNVQPARDSYNPAWSATITGTGLNPSDAIRLTAQSSSTRPGLTTLRISAHDTAGKVLAYQQVSGLLTEPSRGLGPVRFTIPASSTGVGQARVVVPERGRWQLTVQVRVGPTTDYAASTSYLVR
jgi:copper transport protein